MKVKDLITLLQLTNPESDVCVGDDRDPDGDHFFYRIKRIVAPTSDITYIMIGKAF